MNSKDNRNGYRIEILLVEDNPADARLTELALRDKKILITLSIARDGEEALAFLRKEGIHAQAKSPDFILLDLSLPKKDGREVLKEIKSDVLIKHIPVAILTTSDAESDILYSYSMQANCYLVKPLELDRFVEMMNSIKSFWFATARLPRRDEISEPEYP
ncbi:MAG: response regulator [Methanothrix sp.]|nr:response regulator [Methanothrix sp.]